jgi:hypothetical protein
VSGARSPQPQSISLLADSVAGFPSQVFPTEPPSARRRSERSVQSRWPAPGTVPHSPTGQRHPRWRWPPTKDRTTASRRVRPPDVVSACRVTECVKCVSLGSSAVHVRGNIFSPPPYLSTCTFAVQDTNQRRAPPSARVHSVAPSARVQQARHEQTHLPRLLGVTKVVRWRLLIVHGNPPLRYIYKLNI